MQYAYLYLDLFLAIIWIACFLYRANLRKEIMLMSAAVAPLGLLNPVFAIDYFRPQYFLPFSQTHFVGAEDILWAFLIGGISAVVYEEVFRNIYQRRGRRPHPFVLALTSVAMGSIFICSVLLFSLPSIVTGCVLLFVLGAVEIFYRRDLLRDSIVSGTITAIIIFLSYVAWLIPHYPNVMHLFWINTQYVFGVPYQEILFGFVWGMVAGPAYEFALGLSEVRRKNPRKPFMI